MNRPKPVLRNHQVRQAEQAEQLRRVLRQSLVAHLAISNQCARLIANAIIFYNSAILSRLVTKYETAGNSKALALIAKISPAAWRHLLLNGHYTFQSTGKTIDLDALVAGLELE